MLLPSERAALVGSGREQRNELCGLVLQRYLAQNLNPAVYDSFQTAQPRFIARRAAVPAVRLRRAVPGWNEDRAGGFVGIKASHGGSDLYYSILEGVLFSMRQCYDILVDVGGRPDRIVVSGGIVNSDLWMQMAADVFGRELHVTGAINDSTVGGALVALEAVGGCNAGVIDGHTAKIARSVEPRDSAVELFKERYARYLQLYQLLDA